MILVFNIFLLGVLACFVVMFYKTYKLATAHGNSEGAWNAIALIVVVGLFFIFYVTNSISLGFPLIPYPFDVLMLAWAGVLFLVQLLYRRLRKQDGSSAGGYIEKEQFTPRRESARKLTHLAILLLLSVYFGVGNAVFGFIDTLIHDAIALNVSIWGIPGLTFPPSHANWLGSLFGTMGAFYLLAIPEIFRLFDPPAYMLAPATALMRASEQTGPAAPLILILAALVPLGAISNLIIPLSAITIAVIGDGCASIIGRKYGRHKIKFYPVKSYEGLIGGMSAGFSAGVILLLFEYSLLPAVLLATVGSILLGVVDLVKTRVSDNLLNPLFISLGMWICSLLWS